jgi:hypothetical protein
MRSSVVSPGPKGSIIVSISRGVDETTVGRAADISESATPGSRTTEASAISR